MANLDRLTQATYRALQLAQDEALRLNSGDVEPEHLLLGLVREETGNAAAILQTLNIELSLVRKRIERSIQPGQGGIPGKLNLAPRARRVIASAADAARRLGHSHVGTEHLLLGLLGAGDGLAYEILDGLRLSPMTVQAQMETMPRENPLATLPSTAIPVISLPTPFQWPTLTSLPVVSPVFVGIVLVTAAAGCLTYLRVLNPRFTSFLFVLGGWIVSLCLHEFGHAFVAYWGGDRSVADKGYLTLNPLKYTQSMFSIILPLVFLAMGGIGLPGGAVYINPRAIRSEGLRSLMSAAGPIVTGLCALLLLIPFITGLAYADILEHFEFWSSIALLAFLEITALFFNLLPIPGLDGFGIIESFLPIGFLDVVRRFGSLTYILIFLLLFNRTPISQGFWMMIWRILLLANLAPDLVGVGLNLFQFWTPMD
jgi:Zn-dependent protease